jgi:hypothetical protein
MIGARRILIRDWSTNRLFWIAACLANLVYGVAILRGSSTTNSYFDNMGLLLGLADIVILAITTAAVVQTDGPSSRLGDWRTRPVPGGQILLAKMVTILTVIVVPRFLIGIGGGPLFGLTLEESIVPPGCTSAPIWLCVPYCWLLVQQREISASWYWQAASVAL